MNQSPTASLFQNLTVLEVANVLAGPAVGMFFAELGATVIKVENPRTRGDTTRHWKLPAEPGDTDVSGYFSCVNWGKRSIGVAFDTEAGREVVYDLARKSDILLQSFKAGDDTKFKLDYDTLHKIKPALIYAHITAYGVDDDRTGFDAIIQAESGFTGMNGTPESGPIKMPVALMDLLLAHQLKQALLLALIERMQSGKGSNTTVSLIQSGIASLANQAANYLVGKQIPQRTGSDHPNVAPYGTVFRTRDGHDIVLGVGTDGQFRALCKILDIPEMAEDDRFCTNQNRLAHKEVLKPIIEERMRNMDRDPLLTALREARVPAGGVLMMDEVLSQPEAQNLLLEDDKSLRGLRTVAFESDFINTRSPLDTPPSFNQHRDEILKEVLGYSEEDIERLTVIGAVAGD